jgi:hypothetical protein
MISTLLTKSIESSIKTAMSEATVGLHKKIETQEKEPENNFTRFASGVIFSSFIVLFTFDGVAILKYITVVHTSLFTTRYRRQ